MRDLSEQPSEARGKDCPISSRPKKPSLSSPAFAAALIVLIFGGVLAWLALSADKFPGRSVSDVDATVTVDLEGTEPKAAVAPPPEPGVPDAPEDTGETGPAVDKETRTATVQQPGIDDGAKKAAIPENVARDKLARDETPSHYEWYDAYQRIRFLTAAL